MLSERYYIMIKIHRETGLMYLCQTSRIECYEKYLGSGVYWLRHLKIHGNNVETVILRKCDTKEEVRVWGTIYSTMWNIVEQTDNNGLKIWANLKPEEGDGQSSQTALIMNNVPATRKRNSDTQKRVQNDPVVKAKNSELVKKSLQKSEIKEKMISAATISWKCEEVREKRISGITKAHQSPETRKRNSDAQKIAQNRPEVKEKNRLANSGRKNARYDHTEYIFVHATLGRERCTRHDLQLKYNLDGGHLCSLIKGKLKSHKGWKLHT